MIPDHRETQHDTAKTTLQFVAYRLVTSSHNVWFTLLTASGYHTHYVDLYVKKQTSCKQVGRVLVLFFTHRVSN